MNTIITITLLSAIIFSFFTSFTYGSDLIGNSAEFYGAYESTNAHIGSGGDVACCGFASCENSEIFAVAEAREISFIYCYGSKACSGVDIMITNDVQCYGSGSCYNMSIDEHAVTISVRCYGSYSCATDATIRSGTSVIGNGYRSLFGATIQGEVSEDWTWSAILYGYQAAKNSVIYANDGISFTINAKGYQSLMNSNITCMGGATCTVTCNIGACIDSYIYVDDSSTLDLTCQSLEYCITQVSQEDSLPLISDHLFEESDDFDDLTMGVRSLIISKNNHLVLDHNEVPSLSCEEELQCSQMQFNTDAPKTVVFCEGYHACQEIHINLAEINTYCSGHYSCHDATFTSSAISSSSLSSSNTPSTFVACSGFISCFSNTFTNLPYLLGIGYLSAQNAIITDVSKLDAYGNNVFSYSTITISSDHQMTIDSPGFVTFNEAIIYVEGTLIADFKGYHSGYKSEIYCYGNSQCTISCYYYSCKDMTIYYSKSSQIDLKCSDKSDDTDYCAELVELSSAQLHQYEISKKISQI